MAYTVYHLNMITAVYGETFDLHHTSSAPVADVFRHLAYRSGIQPRYITLVFNGRTVRGTDRHRTERPVSDIFRDEEYIHVVFRFAESEWDALMAETNLEELLWNARSEEGGESPNFLRLQSELLAMRAHWRAKFGVVLGFNN